MPNSLVATDWVVCQHDPLPVAEAMTWAVLPGCGAVTSFVGTVRDHAEGRRDVTGVEYEAYPEQVEPRMRAVVESARRRWPEIGRVAVVHRLGPVAVGEPAVLVVVSAPHRAEAFEAARFCIDAVKESVPIWKRETWEGGDGWGLGARPLVDADDVTSP